MMSDKITETLSEMLIMLATRSISQRLYPTGSSRHLRGCSRGSRRPSRRCSSYSLHGRSVKDWKRVAHLDIRDDVIRDHGDPLGDAHHAHYTLEQSKSEREAHRDTSDREIEDH